MLTLYLLRHAKSSWNTPAQSDFDRPLNKRGRKDAAELGRYMQTAAIQPELVLLSSARSERVRLVNSWRRNCRCSPMS